MLYVPIMWNYHTVLQPENLWTRKSSVSFAMHGTQSRGFYLCSLELLHIQLFVSVWKIHCLSCFKVFPTGLLSELKLPLVIWLFLFSNTFKFLPFSYYNILKSTTSISFVDCCLVEANFIWGKSKGSAERTHQPDLEEHQEAQVAAGEWRKRKGA